MHWENEKEEFTWNFTRTGTSRFTAILYLMTLVPIAAYICSLIGMYFYPLTKKGELEMEEHIAAIRKQQREGIDNV